MSVYTFEVSVVGTDWNQTVNAASAGKAKANYWRDVRESWSVPFTAMRARKVGAPTTDSEFLRVAQYRGLPDVRCGDRVASGKNHGTIVGYNCSANFDVLFDADSAYSGQRMNCHPAELTYLPKEQL